MRKVVITAALTGAGDTARANPAVPVTPARIIVEALGFEVATPAEARGPLGPAPA